MINFSRYSKTLKTAWLVAICFAVNPPSAFAQQEWSWRFSAEQYAKLTIPQRTTYERCVKLHEMADRATKENREQDAASAYRAASGEWKLFAREFFDAPEFALAHAAFMEGYELHLAKDRNSAVRIYTEVLTLYPESPLAIIQSLYWRAEAHRQNGDRNKALTDWQQIEEMPGSVGNPLGLLTLQRLAGDAWERMKWEEAAARWEALVRDHPGGSRDVRAAAARNLMMLRGAQGRWQALDSVVEQMRGDAKGRTDYINEFMWNSWHHWHRWITDDYLARAFPKEDRKQIDGRLRKFREGLVDWYEKHGTLYAEADKAWDFDLTKFYYRRMLNPDKASELALALVTKLRSDNLTPAEKDSRARRLINNLVEASMAVEARTLLELIEGVPQRLSVAYSLEERTGHYEEAEKVLDQMEMQPDPDYVKNAKRMRAYLYKDRMNKCKEAIPLFMEAVDPPTSLWAIQECHRRIGEKDKAQQTLTEIASIFPAEASRAMYQKAEYFKADNDKANAIAHYRRILSHPDWKKSGQASQSHQRLEEFGIETGGGVIHNVN